MAAKRKNKRSLSSGLVGFALVLGSFGLFLTLVLPAGRAPMTVRHLALAATWAAAGILSFRSAQSGLRPAIMRPAGLLSLGLLGAIALRGPVTVEGLEILLTWGGFLVAGLSMSAHLELRERCRLLAGLLTFGLLFAVEGIFESCGLLELRRAGIDLEAISPEDRAFFLSTRARSVFGQANGLGGFLLMMLALIGASAGAFWASGLSKIQRLPWILTLGLVGGALVATRSLGSWAVLAVLSAVAAAILWRQARRPMYRWTGLILTLMVGGLLLGLATETILTYFGRIYHPPGHPLHTLTLRGGYARTAARLIAEAPVFGVGWDLYAEGAIEARAPNEGFARRPHNALLGLAAEIGILGWAFVVALFLGALKLLCSVQAREFSARSAETPPRRAVVLGGLGALMIALSQGALPLLPPDERGEPRSGLNFVVVLFLAGVFWFFLARPMAGRILALASVRRAATFLALGFGLHCLIDIDLWIPNLIATLAIFALAVTGTPEPKPLRLKFLVLPLCLVVTFLGLGFATRAQPAARAEAYRNWVQTGMRLKPAPEAMWARWLELELAAAEARPISKRALVNARGLLVFGNPYERKELWDYDEEDLAPLRRDWLRARALIAQAPQGLREIRDHRFAEESLGEALRLMDEAPAAEQQVLVDILWGNWSHRGMRGW